MSNLTTFRVRWLDGAGMAIVEKRHKRSFFGLWPVYEWEGLEFFPTVADGMKWILEQAKK